MSRCDSCNEILEKDDYVFDNGYVYCTECFGETEYK